MFKRDIGDNLARIDFKDLFGAEIPMNRSRTDNKPFGISGELRYVRQQISELYLAPLKHEIDKMMQLRTKNPKLPVLLKFSF